MKQLLIVLSIFFAFNNINAQDSLAHSNKRNTIRWNPTPMILVGPKSIVFGYERIVNPNQSISINIGTLVKKPFTTKEGDEIHLLEENNRGGFLASIDYRFYFKNRNKRLAPDGVYWGPYFSHYNLWFDGNSDILENGVTINNIAFDANLKMTSLGIILGYQFVIKDRFTIDMILSGPSYTYYQAKLGFNAKVELDKDSEFYDDLHDVLEQITPGLSSVLDKHELTSSGRLNFAYYGYRYLVQFGYRF